MHVLSDILLILVYDWDFKVWNVNDLAKIITELLKFNSEQISKMKPLLYELLKQNKVRISMETAWNPWRKREYKSKHENAFIYFLVPLYLCPCKLQAVILMNTFKPQRELRRTIFDRSEEGAKYSSPVREIYSIIFSSPLPSPEQSLHLSMWFLCRSCCTASLAVTWLGQNEGNIVRYFCPILGGSFHTRQLLRSISKLILYIFPQYNFHLPNSSEFLKCSHIS